MLNKPVHITEILIIGGGIAGCIAAISLAEHFQVTLIDKLEEPVERVGESLAPAAQRILRQLHLLEDEPEWLQQQLFHPNLGMQSYWGSNQVHFVDHLRNPDGFSRSLDRQKFECYLRKVAEKRGVSCIWGAKLHNSSYTKNGWEVIFKSNTVKNRNTHSITASFVIDATGRNSHFTRILGITRTHYDRLVSCWMSFPNTEINTMSTIVSEQLGWWYSAVVPGNKRILSFQTDADLVTRSTFKTAENFLDLINTSAIMHQLVKKTAINTINFHGAVSANSTRLNQVAGKQWIALGDAAISFDPLSSQGMFNAMACAVQVKELLINFNFINTPDSSIIKDFNHAYSEQIKAVWKHYLKHKNIFYSVETRWQESPFWQRRHQFSKVI